MNFNKITVIKIAAVMLLSLFSANSAFAAGWTNIEKVTLLYPYGSEVPGANAGILLQLENKANPDFCSGDAFLSLNESNSAFDTIFAILLSSQASDTPVRIFLSGCTGAGTNGWPKVLHIQKN